MKFKCVLILGMFVVVLSPVFCGCSARHFATNSTMLANPWVDCGHDDSCASNIAGFDFPIKVAGMKIRAMKDMIEIIYPLDNSKNVIIRKTTEENYNNFDISGDYNRYPIKDTLRLDNGVEFIVRRDKNLIYVAYLGAESGFYSIRCDKGITAQELQDVYDVIANAEAYQFEN